MNRHLFTPLTYKHAGCVLPMADCSEKLMVGNAHSATVLVDALRLSTLLLLPLKTFAFICVHLRTIALALSLTAMPLHAESVSDFFNLTENPEGQTEKPRQDVMPHFILCLRFTLDVNQIQVPISRGNCFAAMTFCCGYAINLRHRLDC